MNYVVKYVKYMYMKMIFDFLTSRCIEKVRSSFMQKKKSEFDRSPDYDLHKMTF